MTWQNYQLDNTVSKANEALTIWQTERGLIKISKNALACSIRLDNQQKGYIFHGHCKLLLDTIVETDEGAIGKPVDKEVNDLFLMLGNTEKIHQHFSAASQEDFTKMDYKNQQEFVAKAEDLFNRFFEKRIINRHRYSTEDHGVIFAFQNENSGLDIVVADDSKLVYKATDIVFVSNENKVILKSPSELVCTSNGKSVIIKK